MKTIKSEIAFDPTGFNGNGGNGGNGRKRPPPPRGRGDDDDDKKDKGPIRRATFEDVADGGHEVFHPFSGDRAFKQGGKFYLEGGDMATMVADEDGVEWDGKGPLKVEVKPEMLKQMMSDPDDPEGWHIGPPPTPSSRNIDL